MDDNQEIDISIQVRRLDADCAGWSRLTPEEYNTLPDWMYEAFCDGVTSIKWERSGMEWSARLRHR